MKSKKWMALALAATLSLSAFATPYTTYAIDETSITEISTDDVEALRQKADELLEKAEKYKDKDEVIASWCDALDRMLKTDQFDAQQVQDLGKELENAIKAFEEKETESPQTEGELETEELQEAPKPLKASEGDLAEETSMETETKEAPPADTGETTGEVPGLSDAIDNAKAAIASVQPYVEENTELKTLSDALQALIDANPSTEEQKQELEAKTKDLNEKGTAYAKELSDKYQEIQDKQQALTKVLEQKIDVTGVPENIAKKYNDAVTALETLVQKDPREITLQNLTDAENALNAAAAEVKAAKEQPAQPKEDSEAVKAAKAVLKSAEKYKDDKDIKPAYDALQKALAKETPDDAEVKTLAEKLNIAVKQKEQPAQPKEDSEAVKAAKAVLKSAEKYKDDKDVKPAYDALQKALAKETPDDAEVKTLAEKLSIAVKQKEQPEKPAPKKESEAVQRAKSTLKVTEKYLGDKNIKKAYDALKKALEKDEPNDEELLALIKDLNKAVYEAMRPESKKMAKNYKELRRLLKKAYRILQNKYEKKTLGKEDDQLYYAYLSALDVANQQFDNNKAVDDAIDELEAALAKYKKPVKKKRLPKTGVQEMSAMAMAASALIGAGIVVSKKRK